MFVSNEDTLIEEFVYNKIHYSPVLFNMATTDR